MCERKLLDYGEEFRRQIITEKPGVEKYFASIFLYFCPKCGEKGQIVFVRIWGNEVYFSCSCCQLNFAVEDQESGLLIHKVNRLKERYPRK